MTIERFEVQRTIAASVINSPGSSDVNRSVVPQAADMTTAPRRRTVHLWIIALAAIATPH